MKKNALGFIALFALTASFSVMAEDAPVSFPPFMHTPLNKISYQVMVEKWATSDTAKVTVNMDGALDKIGLSNTNKHLLTNLNKIAPNADWHITQFNRDQDKSGLDMLHIVAEARLSQNMLSDLRNKAKEITKPGETYTINNIDFSPTLVEMQKTEAEARAEIYAQVKQEIDRLNKAYPEQHYFLNEIDLNSGASPTPTPMMFKGGRNMMAEVSMAASSSNMTDVSVPVNAKVTEIAQVVIAAKMSSNKSIDVSAP